MFIQPVQRAPQTVVVEVLRHDPRSQQMLHGFVREELGHEIEPAVAASQSVADHRGGRRAHAHLLPVPWLLLIQPVGDPDLSTHLGDQAQMIEVFDHIP